MLGSIGATPVSSLEVDIAKLRSQKGVLRLCLTADPKNFPGCVDDAHAVTRTVPASQAQTIYDGLPPGNYAVAVIHDANNNKKLDTFMGIPREGFGFSRDPAIGFGPPKFRAAAFDVAGPRTVQHITMHYLL
ncbi:DUF2141 domain-containing protein [Sphingomonas sp.]|uniref:DUF2141 domain-containing protein n=1 Tax=Sphingomonas sp. TaxID=28214 RepID=UPI0025DEDC65|nr:DUF2141 domain-containing protein [Sphingomonas sp.]